MYGYGYRYNSGLVVGAGGGAPFVNTYSTQFDGIDDYVECGNMTALDAVQNFTISAWVNYDNVSGTKRMIGKRHFSNLIAFNFDSNVLVGGINSAGVTSNLGLVAGTWYHIAMVFDGTLTGNENRLKIYVNGVQETLTFTGAIPSVTYDFALNPNTFFLGTDGFTTPNYFGGKMDEVSIFNTSEPIANLWDGSGTPTDLTDLSPIAWYRMGDNGAYKSPQWLIPSNENKDKVSNYSFEFDAVDDYVSTSSKIIASDITLSGWVNFNGSYSSFTGHFPLSITPSNISAPNETLGRFYKDGSTLQIAMQGNDNTGANFSTYYVDNTTLEGAGWQHICLTYNVTTKHIYAYLNGVAQNWVKIFGASTPVPFLTAVSGRLYESDLTIGRVEPTTSTGSFLGLVDEVSTYNRILTQAEITALYNSGTPTTLPSGAVAHYRMGEEATFSGGVWTVPDSVGSNNGTSNAMTIEDRVGNAPNSENNALSLNMESVDRTTDVPT